MVRMIILTIVLSFMIMIQMDKVANLKTQIAQQNQQIHEMKVSLNSLSKEVDALYEPAKPLTDDEKVEHSILQFDNQVKYLTDEQRSSLELARNVGEKDDLSLAMMGVCMQETLCGVIRAVGDQSAPIGKRSYGIMQVKVTATKDVLKRYPELGSFKTDEEIIAKLITDDKWNMEIALGYLKILKERYGFNWKSMLTAYNLGPGGAMSLSNPESYKYSRKVVGHLQKMNVWEQS